MRILTLLVCFMFASNCLDAVWKQCHAQTYDATGTWIITLSDNWVNPGNAGCPPVFDDGESNFFVLNQTEDGITMVDSDGISYDANVNGLTYTFTASQSEDGITITITFNFTLSSSTSGVGDLSWYVTFDTYYCNGGATVSAIKAQPGMILWEFNTGYRTSSSPAIATDGTIYVGSGNWLNAFYPDGTKKWEFMTGNHTYYVHSSPAIGTDGTIYVGAGVKLYSLNPDGTKKWELITGAGFSIKSSPTLSANGTIYMGFDDYKIRAIHSDSSGLANSAWPMFRNNARHTGNVFSHTKCSSDSYEFDDSSSQSTTIISDVSQSHSICPVGDKDWLTFTLANDSEVIIETSGPHDDMRMWLYDSSLIEIEFNDDDGIGRFSRIDRLCGTDELPAGTYFVKLEESGNNDKINSYDISLIAKSCDADADSILDSWEIDNFGNLTTADKTTDYDGDGLLDKDEYASKTNPKKEDSDSDSIHDGWEVTYGLDPLVYDCDEDPDGDGRTNCQEYLDGTDPKVFNLNITNIIQDWTGTDDVTVTWVSESDVEYQIAVKDDFADAFSVVDSVTALTESTSWTDDGSQTGTHPSAVQQRYYKVIQDGVDSENIVGMYKIAVNEGMNLISLPLVPFNTALEDVIGVQVKGADNIGESDLLWVWDGTKYMLAWLVSGAGPPYDGNWYTGNNPTTVQFGADQGAWLQIRPGHGTLDLKFVGEVSDSNKIIPLIEGNNLVGTCYSGSVELSQSNLWESGFLGADNIGESDIIWNWVGDHFEFIWLADGVNETLNGKWFIGNSEVNRRFEPGSGYWIQRREGHFPFDWNYLNH